MRDYNEPVRIRRALTFPKFTNHHRTISKKFLRVFRPSSWKLLSPIAYYADRHARQWNTT